MCMRTRGYVLAICLLSGMKAKQEEDKNRYGFQCQSFLPILLSLSLSYFFLSWHRYFLSLTRKVNTGFPLPTVGMSWHKREGKRYREEKWDEPGQAGIRSVISHFFAESSLFPPQDVGKRIEGWIHRTSKILLMAIENVKCCCLKNGTLESKSRFEYLNYYEYTDHKKRREGGDLNSSAACMHVLSLPLPPMCRKCSNWSKNVPGVCVGAGQIPPTFIYFMALSTLGSACKQEGRQAHTWNRTMFFTLSLFFLSLVLFSVSLSLLRGEKRLHFVAVM